ncbi:MAG: hypothetical protein R3B96_14250 [Pirellulaceae bacterium]
MWLVVFLTVFVAVSYLLRDPDGQRLADGEPSVEQTENGDTLGDATDATDRADANSQDVDALPGDESASTHSDDGSAAGTGRNQVRPVSQRGGLPRAARPPMTADESTGTAAPLVEVRADVAEPGGIAIQAGKRRGHRLKHLARHFQDDASRPIHGVFDGELSEVIGLIDQAYQWSEANDRRASVKQERGRTVIIARFDRRVGYVGGERGERDGHPAVSKVQVVLEDRDVITAYPVD